MLLAREGERSAEAGRIARSERVLRGRGARPARPSLSEQTVGPRDATAGFGVPEERLCMAVEPPAPRLTATPRGRHYHSALGNRMGESAVSWAVPFRRTTADEQEDS